MPVAALLFVSGPVALLVLPLAIVLAAQLVTRVRRRDDRWGVS